MSNWDQTHNCICCGAEFNMMQVLSFFAGRDTADKPYNCFCCETAFAPKEVNGCPAYERLFTRNDRKCFLCGYCGEIFDTKRIFDDHEKLHVTSRNLECRKILKVKISEEVPCVPQEPKSYLCCYCGGVYTNRPYFNAHLKTHTNPNSYKCWCGAVFSLGGSYRQHKMIHATEKRHKCELCGSTFSNCSNLKQHMKFHSGIKPHPCVVCGKAFAVRSGLKSHLRLHTGETPYKCKSCGEAFVRNEQLVRHWKISHPEEGLRCLEVAKHCRSRRKKAKGSRILKDDTRVTEENRRV